MLGKTLWQGSHDGVADYPLWMLFDGSKGPNNEFVDKKGARVQANAKAAEVWMARIASAN